jgi:hypothetical protein
MTGITAENLLAAGYRAYPPSMLDQGSTMLYQKCFRDDMGKRFYLNFREWPLRPNCPETFDANISGETNTGGHFWLTIKEDTIEATESRAEVIWSAFGGVYYEVQP